MRGWSRGEKALSLAALMFIAMVLLVRFLPAGGGEVEFSRAAAAYPEPAEDAARSVKAPETELININTAGAQTLETLPGIGPKLAQRIIDYRTEHGPFTDVSELTEVNGIGEGILEDVRGYICIS